MLISGLTAFDELYPNLLQPGFVIAIAGPYGSGKTLLASTICHANAARGNHCLYITFFEDKDKFYRITSSLGMNFQELEKKSVFTYARLPLTRSIDRVLEELARTILSKRPKIVVIDSVNPLLEFVTDPDRRAVLHDFFSQVPRLINGILIMTVEEKEEKPIEDVEYVADVYIVLRYGSERGFVTRTLCIKKARGSPLTQMEIPFTIKKNRGIVLLVYEKPRVIKSSKVLYKGLVEPFKSYLGYIRAGENILVTYPIDTRIPHWLFLLLQLSIANELKALSISYSEGPDEQRSLVLDLVKRYIRISGEEAQQLIDRYMVFESINPYSSSLTEFMLEENMLIEKYRPDIVLFNGVDSLYPIVKKNMEKYYQFLVNQVLEFKREGITSIRSMGYISAVFYKLVASVSDIIIRFNVAREPFYHIYAHLWRRGKEPTQIVFDDRTTINILNDLIKFIKNKENKG